MPDSYLKIFSRLPPVNPTPELAARVIKLGIRRQTRQARQRLARQAAGAAGALAIFILAVGMLRADLARSDLPALLRLAATDPAILMTFGQDFAQSLLESLPTVSALAFCLALAALLAAFKALVGNGGNWFSQLRVFIRRQV